MWIQILFYSLAFFLVFIIIGDEVFGVKRLIATIFPVTFEQWWFASTYFLLYIISPYINKLLNALNKKEYRNMLIVLTVCWSIIPTFSGQDFQSNQLLWFVYLYALSGYVRIHVQDIEFSGLKYIVASLILIALTFTSVVIFDLLGVKISFFSSHATYFYGQQRLPILLISFFLFLGFGKIKITYSKLINLVASATFGVYLIHDNNYVRSFLWDKLFCVSDFSNSLFLIPYTLYIVAVVFIVCTIIELCRIHYIEKTYMKVVRKITDMAKDKYNNSVKS